jgi:hypothetical protein
MLLIEMKQADFLVCLGVFMCEKPCKECPYKNSSAPGYFGPNDGLVYRHAINREAIVPCHMKSSHDVDGVPDKIVPCKGLVVSMIKSCRAPVNPELNEIVSQLRDRDDIDELKANALASWEFADYHGLKDTLV